MTVALEALLNLCANARTLPELPEAAFRLVQELDSREPNLVKAERIILSDPGLTAKVLRSACSAAYGLPADTVKTVGGAINIIGLKNLHGIAVAAWVQSTFSSPSKGSKFDTARFAAHGAFAGFLAKYLLNFGLRKGASSKVTPDEIFTGAVLYDLGVAVLAFVAPKINCELEAHAEASGSTIGQTFEREFGIPIAKLGYVAGKTWGLPESLLFFLGSAAGELEADSLADACLKVAKCYATFSGYGLHGWRHDVPLCDEELELIGISTEEMPEVLDMVKRYVGEYASGPAKAA